MMKANNLTRNILIALVAGAMVGMALTFALKVFWSFGQICAGPGWSNIY